MNRPRLISTLGIGRSPEPPHYDETVYAFEGVASTPTPVVARALCDIFEPAGLVVLGTPEVRGRWIETGLLGGIVRRPFHFVDIPHGKNDSQLWAMFEAFNNALRSEPIAEAGETESPDGLVIDVTHGLRIQPIFLMAALAFTMSEWAREGRDLLPVRIVYGAFEATASGEPTPIWDLTRFVTVSQWNAALDAFLRYGRADDMERLAKAESNESKKQAMEAGESGAALAVHAFLRRLGDQLKTVADDLALLRTHDLLTNSAPRLLEMLNQPECDRWLERLPLLAGAVALLKARVAPLATVTVIDRDGLKAQGRLAKTYVDLQRYSEAAVTIREGLVTHYALEHDDLAPLLVPPRKRQCEAQRETIEKRWRLDSFERGKVKPDANDEAVIANLALSYEFQNTRNDIEHGGFREAASDSSRLRKKVEVAASFFATIVGGDPLRSAPPSSEKGSKGFVNLSNHPLTHWSEAQRQAALDLGHGEPLELPDGVREVAADADEPSVEALAKSIVTRVQALGASGAFVATELTLTLALVRALQARGIRCYNATTHRDAHERVLPDGSVEKTSHFEFVRWREYPIV